MKNNVNKKWWKKLNIAPTIRNSVSEENKVESVVKLLSFWTNIFEDRSMFMLINWLVL